MNGSELEQMFTEWWPQGRAWWIQNSESVQNLVKKAFYDAWRMRDDQLARIARTPDSSRVPEPVKSGPPMLVAHGPVPAPGEQSPGWRDYPGQHASQQHLPGPPPVTRITDYTPVQPPEPSLRPADHPQWSPGRFEGTSELGVMPRLAPVMASDDHRERQRYVETQMMPAIAESGPQFEHTDTVWDGQEDRPAATRAFPALNPGQREVWEAGVTGIPGHED